MVDEKKSDSPVEVTPPQLKENKDNLNMNDLTLVLSIIDTVSQRGAIHGGELEEVGRLRNKVAKFIQENSKQPEK